jgi:hypothetical protein
MHAASHDRTPAMEELELEVEVEVEVEETIDMEERRRTTTTTMGRRRVGAARDGSFIVSPWVEKMTWIKKKQ